MSVLNLGWGIVTIVLPVLLLHDLGYGETVVGIAFAVSGVTGGIGALVAGRWRIQGRERPLLFWPMLMIGAATAALVVWPTLPVALAVMAFTGLLNGPMDVALFTLRQRRTDPAWMGRAFAVSMSINFLGYPIGAAIGGVLVVTSTEAAFTVAVVFLLLAGVLGALLLPRSRSRRRRPRRPRTRPPRRPERPSARRGVPEGAVRVPDHAPDVRHRRRVDRPVDVRVDPGRVVEPPRAPRPLEVERQQQERPRVVAVEAVRDHHHLVVAVGAVDEPVVGVRGRQVRLGRVLRVPGRLGDEVERRPGHAPAAVAGWSTLTQRRSSVTWITVGPDAASAVRSAPSNAASVSTRTPRAPQARAAAAKSSGPRSVPGEDGLPAPVLVAADHAVALVVEHDRDDVGALADGRLDLREASCPCRRRRRARRPRRSRWTSAAASAAGNP